MTRRIHPREALFDRGVRVPALPVCDHYAGSERFIRKALEMRRETGLPFDVTFDLEDGASVGSESLQLDMVVGLILTAVASGERVGVRVHDPAHPHFEIEIRALTALAPDTLAYITIPKITDLRQGQEAVRTVQRYYQRSLAGRGIEETASRPFLPLHLIIETHGALASVADIARLPGVEALDFGIMDFVSAHDGAIPRAAMKSPEQFRHPLVVRAKTEIAAHALAAGVVPSHNVTIDVGDPQSAGSDARRAYQELGFLRMWSIHPSQIAPIIGGMRPGNEEIELAASVLREAAAADWRPIRFNNELFDRASYRFLWTLLERAELTGAPIPEGAREQFFAPLTPPGQ